MAYSPYSVQMQLMQYLPSYNNLFHTQTNVTATIAPGNPQTLTITLPGHGLTNGQFITLANSLVNNPITGVSMVSNMLIFATANDHDLTLEYQSTVNLSGFTDSSINGTQDLLNVTGPNQFDIGAPNNNLPVLTGNEILIQHIENGLDGIWPVTVIDPNTITISLAGAMPMNPGSVNNLTCNYNYRIWPVYDLQSALELYTKQQMGNGALFIIFDDAHASKNAYIETEAKETLTNANQVKQLIINNFTISAIFPTDQLFSPASIINTCWTSLLSNMFAIISGYDFKQSQSSYMTMLSTHGPAQYNKAYYIHNYNFEYNYYITNDDLFLSNNKKTRRMNSISFEMLQDNIGNYVDSGSINIVGGQ